MRRGIASPGLPTLRPRSTHFTPNVTVVTAPGAIRGPEEGGPDSCGFQGRDLGRKRRWSPGGLSNRAAWKYQEWLRTSLANISAIGRNQPEGKRSYDSQPERGQACRGTPGQTATSSADSYFVRGLPVTGTACTAFSIRLVTRSGWETMTTWLDFTSSVVARIRCAKARSASGGIT